MRSYWVDVKVDPMYRDKPYTDMRDMMKADSLFSYYGMELEDYGPGWSRVTMLIQKNMLNAYAAAHGAVIFALADVAFAIACNAHGAKAVGLSMNINYRKPACENERLIAEARGESVGKTTGLFRIRIINGEGKLVALADGLAFISQK